MKYFTSLILLLALGSTVMLSQPCLPDGITFSSQQEIDSFQVNYPNCTEIGSDLIVTGEDITNLDGLNPITSIDGKLEILNNSVLMDISGLQNLITVYEIHIGWNNVLTNLQGLDNVDPQTLNYLRLVWNISLHWCNVKGICDYLELDSSQFDISWNLSGCGNKDQILDRCNEFGCLYDGITFSTQQEIDDFHINYPGCLDIGGHVLIDGSNITNLNGLLGLRSVEDYLFIKHNGSLNSLSGLDSLERVGKAFHIQYNYVLTDLTGLGKLDSVGKSFNISNNANLSSFNGVNHLEYIGEGLWIEENAMLRNVDGLDNLSFIDVRLRVVSNNSLQNLNGLNMLDSIDGSIYMNNNASLLSINGLKNLTHLISLTITGSDALLSLEGLNNIKQIEYELQLGGLDAVSTLSPLNNLDSVGSLLYIGGNHSLINLGGLNNLQYVGGRLEIVGNRMLRSLSGIENINGGSISYLQVQGNDSLYSCNVHSICDYLASPSGEIYISDNFDGCNSKEEVESGCDQTSSCLPDGITFSSQTAIDNFNSAYPECNIIEGNVVIEGSDISNLNGLSQITYIEGNLIINDNQNLQSLLGLDNVEYVVGDLEIFDNNSLVDLSGLDALTYIGGNLHIGTYQQIGPSVILQGNDALESLHGLKNLEVVGGGLWLILDTILEDISALENMNSIGGDLIIWGNDALTSLNGLDNVLSYAIDDIQIMENTSLTECAIKLVCDYLDDPPGSIAIYLNDTGCATITQVAEACESFGISEYPILDCSIYPNPAFSEINIVLPDDVKLTELNIYSISGQLLIHKTHQVKVLDISSLQHGMYMLEILLPEGRIMKKLIKQ